MFGMLLFPVHRYLLCSTGTNLKAKYYDTRLAAEQAMHSYCAKHGIKIECRERDRHERCYTNHEGARFYINRV